MGRWAVLVVLAGCSAAGGAGPRGGAPTDAAAEEPAKGDVVRAELPREGAPDAAPASVVDAAPAAVQVPPVVVPPEVPPEVPDAAAPETGADASVASPDAGPCVDYVDAPSSSNGWAAWAHYTLSPNSFRSVPYYCGAVSGPVCAGNISSRTGGQTRLQPLSGACRIPVPSGCSPCTNGVTEW